jgi:hypothetical protein
VSEAEIEAVYNIDSLDNERFLDYNFQELRKLSNYGNAKQKEWLKQFLLDLPDSKQKEILSAALR